MNPRKERLARQSDEIDFELEHPDIEEGERNDFNEEDE